MQKFLKQHMITDQKGAVAAIIAICLVVFVGITAFAVDIGHMYVVRNELQNAADAGALAGASALLKADGSINNGANAIALKAANENTTDTGGANPINAEVASAGAYIVRRGHWSFTVYNATKNPDQAFTPNDSLTQTDLWGVTAAELDENPAFINAVRVYTERKVAPVAQWFGKILGKENQEMQTRAVAYIAFAGSLNETEADTPIAICDQAICIEDPAYPGDRDRCKYDCGQGRMSNSSGKDCVSNTTAWTDFAQPCAGAADANTMRSLICGTGNSVPITGNAYMSDTNGVVESVFSKFRECWLKNSNNGTKPWEVTLPVIDCERYPGPIDNCSKVVGAVTVNIMWVQEKASVCYTLPKKNDKDGPHYPTSMAAIPGSTPPYDSWISPIPSPVTEADFKAIWKDFFEHFHLQNSALPQDDGTPCLTFCDSKAIYFLPDCTPHEAVGGNGGPNRGVMARIPSLVN
jgi:Flp pilus assembly protein TadG